MFWGDKPVTLHLNDTVAKEKYYDYSPILNRILEKALEQEQKICPIVAIYDLKIGNESYTLWTNQLSYECLTSSINVYVLAKVLEDGSYYHLLFIQMVRVSSETTVLTKDCNPDTANIQDFYTCHDNMVNNPDPAYSPANVKAALMDVDNIDISNINT